MIGLSIVHYSILTLIYSVVAVDTTFTFTCFFFNISTFRTLYDPFHYKDKGMSNIYDGSRHELMLEMTRGHILSPHKYF